MCVAVGGTRLHWWRLDPDEMDYNLIPQLYVIDVRKAYEDLDGPRSFCVPDRLKGEWHALKTDEQVGAAAGALARPEGAAIYAGD